MSAPLIQGWCPSVHAPMHAADGLLVRVKPRVDGLGADQLRLIAELAQRHGSGRIELTGRANLQVRGLSEAGAVAFAHAVVAAGLASPGPDTEARRNIMIAPDAGMELLALGRALEAWLEREDGPALPPKFGFALGSAPGDLVLLARPWRIRLDGAALEAETADPLAGLQALAAAFPALGADLAPSPRRMRTLVAAVGAETVFARAGLSPQAAIATATPWPLVGGEGSGFRLGVAFGAADTAQLRSAAELSTRFGSGRLALTTARTLHLAGVAPEHHPALAAAASQAGFIVDPADPRLAVHACVGRSGCARSPADVRADALRLAAAWSGPGALHVSGCAKGCAHAGAATVLLAREDGDGYDLIPHGHPWIPPSRTRLSLDQAADLFRQDPAAL